MKHTFGLSPQSEHGFVLHAQLNGLQWIGHTKLS